MRRLILFLLFFVMIGAVHAQFTYGTTGLLNMPTADMQRDKTFMFGGGFLEKHATPARWTYNTFNYYLDITIFPWLEVSYICTLHKAMEVDPAYGPGFWVPSTYGKFVNQDRNFAVRLRLWKEGWWKPWTPQIVLGANDALNNSWTEGSKIEMSSATANGFYSRYYLAVTKHLSMKEVGEWGLHLAYVYNRRKDYPLNGPAIGANFRFSLSPTSFINKAINNLNLMAEYDSKSINCGFEYSFWKDYINAIVELNRCKYFGEHHIEDLTFLDKEDRSENIHDKGIIYDLYCRTSTGEYIIVEMQNRWHSHFLDRTLYYVFRPGQRSCGEPEFPSDLSPVSLFYEGTGRMFYFIR